MVNRFREILRLDPIIPATDLPRRLQATLSRLVGRVESAEGRVGAIRASGGRVLRHYDLAVNGYARSQQEISRIAEALGADLLPGNGREGLVARVLWTIAELRKLASAGPAKAARAAEPEEESRRPDGPAGMGSRFTTTEAPSCPLPGGKAYHDGARAVREAMEARVARQRSCRDAKVAGVGREEPTVTNERGARQSRLNYRCDLLPALASLAVSAVLHDGAAKYGADNWRGIPVRDHLNHALVHVFAFLAGDAQDDHLEHAACRALMALELHLSAKGRAAA